MEQSQPRHPKSRTKQSKSKPAPFTNFYTPENSDFYAKFKYRPLDKKYEEIRLLDVDLTGGNNHRMIHSISLATTGKYCAISYYSGNPKDTVPVWIEGIKMNIFSNLAKGIDNAASFWKKGSPNQPLRLWVDQICINQSDLPEKSHQVNFMREIYRNATHVYVSMPIQRNLRPVFQWLTGLEAARTTKGYEPSPNMLYENPPPEPNIPERWRDKINPEWPADSWEDMYRVINHSWWSRSWVYQEFIVASEVFFLFSDEVSVPWNQLHPILSLFMELDTVNACKDALQKRDQADDTMHRYKIFASIKPMKDHLRSAFKAALGMGHHVQRLGTTNASRALVNRIIEGKELWEKQKHQINLSYLLQHARNTETSQPKDKFYAFVGLANLGNEVPIRYEPSYSIQAVLIDVACAIVMNEDAGLDILAQAGTAAHSRDLPEGKDALPSWVPDWDKREDIERQKFIDALELPPACSAGTIHSSKASLDFLEDRHGNERRVLVAAGTQVDVLGSAIDRGHDGFLPWTSFSSSDGQRVITTTSIAHFEDEVWVLDGMSWPVVLRRSSADDSTTLLAIAMVRENGQPHQVMFGDKSLSGEAATVVIV
ncbi:hypothetical protein CSIM01_02893 [Colletotrichum simmondsii]|uniref:Heterokaryon incompatibility domain-containing protein n=1 Tax=Colletotrichum simmondsii TaxID=703756 RepID=A0A135RSC8_9PEZI|nr:hypothetical protein CSIM01_02893 [Colletotrichum simmondsii]